MNTNLITNTKTTTATATATLAELKRNAQRIITYDFTTVQDYINLDTSIISKSQRNSEKHGTTEYASVIAGYLFGRHTTPILLYATKNINITNGIRAIKTPLTILDGLQRKTDIIKFISGDKVKLPRSNFNSIFKCVYNELMSKRFFTDEYMNKFAKKYGKDKIDDVRLDEILSFDFTINDLTSLAIKSFYNSPAPITLLVDNVSPWQQQEIDEEQCKIIIGINTHLSFTGSDKRNSSFAVSNPTAGTIISEIKNAKWTKNNAIKNDTTFANNAILYQEYYTVAKYIRKHRLAIKCNYAEVPGSITVSSADISLQNYIIQQEIRKEIGMPLSNGQYLFKKYGHKIIEVLNFFEKYSLDNKAFEESPYAMGKPIRKTQLEKKQDKTGYVDNVHACCCGPTIQYLIFWLANHYGNTIKTKKDFDEFMERLNKRLNYYVTIVEPTIATQGSLMVLDNPNYNGYTIGKKQRLGLAKKFDITEWFELFDNALYNAPYSKR